MRNGQPPAFTSPYDVDMVPMDTRISVNGRGPLYSPYYHEMTIENEIPRGDRESRASGVRGIKRPYFWNTRCSTTFLCYIIILSILGLAILLLITMITGLSYTNGK